MLLGLVFEAAWRSVRALFGSAEQRGAGGRGGCGAGRAGRAGARREEAVCAAAGGGVFCPISRICEDLNFAQDGLERRRSGRDFVRWGRWGGRALARRSKGRRFAFGDVCRQPSSGASREHKPGRSARSPGALSSAGVVYLRPVRAERPDSTVGRSCSRTPTGTSSVRETGRPDHRARPQPRPQGQAT